MGSKISITGQIAEVKRELAMREQVYPRQVAAGKMKAGEADMLMDRMRAVLATLMFCQQHEQDIRRYMDAKKAGLQ
jgi:hypothetical protein